jgi:Putative stress-responsive transcriptional regulator
MKKVVNVGIGKRTFTIDEDAYNRLNAYLNAFKQRTKMGFQAGEVMDELEMRIADLFSQELKPGEVVDIELVNKVISQLGMPDSDEDASKESFGNSNPSGSNGSNGYDGAYDFTGNAGGKYSDEPVHRFYRDPRNCAIGGVCSGIAAYFNIDIVLVRVLMCVLLLCASAGFWIYIIFWIVAPKADTAAKQCELRGLPVTAENLRRFTI